MLDKDDIQDLIMKNWCFQTIYAMSLSYPFRLDVKNKRIHFIGPILSHFKMKPIMENYPEEVLTSGFILENDLGAFRRIVDCMYQGKKSDEFFRAYTPEGQILWYQARYCVNNDADGNPEEVIGEFVNVQEKKDLELKARTDCLTSCLNKLAFQRLVEEELQYCTEEDKYALLIIDLDNFKIINDKLGHPFGDEVLKEVGFKLNQIFSKGEYIGRIGGDEFMIFLKCNDGTATVESLAQKVVNAFTKYYADGDKMYQTTASIGIALCPDYGIHFDILYKHADIALYHMKSKGKNGYTFYDASMGETN